MSDHWGRRLAMLVFTLFSLMGWVVVAVAPLIEDPQLSVILLFSGRFLNGLGDSLSVSPAIMFVCEMSTTHLRGMFMSASAVMATSGIPIAYVVGSLVSWRITAAVGFCFPAFTFAMFCLVITADSPVYLMSKGYMEESLGALRWYRKNVPEEEIMAEFKSMEAGCAKKTQTAFSSSNSISTCRWLQLFSEPETQKPLIIVTTLLILLPLTGTYSMTFFAMDIFRELGFEEATVYAAVIAATLRAFGTVIAGVIVVFKGRRFVLLLSCCGTIICIELATASILIKDLIPEEWSSLVTPICDCSLMVATPAFMFFIGVGMTPVPWILLGEWFVAETKSVIGGVVSAIYFLSALASLQVYLHLK